MSHTIRMIEEPGEMAAVEALQRIVWPGSESDAVPQHMLRAAAHNGGLILGAYNEEGTLEGMAFGIPALYESSEGLRLKHYSHMLAVHPRVRDRGLGFRLKRAQWQMVRQQGIELITWTYDPLLSRNAHLNIQRLGAVCSTYLVDFYGPMQDGLNAGLPTDRFEVNWWVNARRVYRRLSREVRQALSLAQYLAAEAPVLNAAGVNAAGLPTPAEAPLALPGPETALCLVEIPADFQALRGADLGLAAAWRTTTRALFAGLFGTGFLATDFVHEAGKSYYVLSHGESTL